MSIQARVLYLGQYYFASRSVAFNIMPGNRQAPFFVDGELNNLTINVNKKTTFTLPKMRDVDLDDIKPQIYLRDAENFTKYKNKEFTFEPTDSDGGNHTIDVVLVDENTNPLANFYTLNIQVVSPRGPRPKVSLTLNATITHLSNFGDLTITFNEDIHIIKDFKN